MTLGEIATMVFGFAAGVGFTILFSRWLLWGDVLIETRAHTGDDDTDEWVSPFDEFDDADEDWLKRNGGYVEAHE
jgi:hypothetical protein